MRKNYVFLIVGHFGSGKSSIVNYYPHTLSEDGVTTEVNGLLSVGGKAGADNFSQYKLKKEEYFSQIFSKDSNYLIHGNIFANYVDLMRYRKGHQLVLFVLRNSYETVYTRAKIRNEKTNFNIKKYIFMENRFNKNVSFCKFLKDVIVHEIDNNRSLDDVSNDIWSRIFALIGKDKV